MTTPIISIEFKYLPSWNDFLAAGDRAKSGMIKTWRKKGFDAAIRAAKADAIPVEEWTEVTVNDNGKLGHLDHAKVKYPLQGPFHTVVRYWRSSNIRFDSWNLFAKPVVDGMVEAGLFTEDNFTVMPDIDIRFMGVDKSLALSKEARELKSALKRAGKGKKRSQSPGRYIFEFYHLSGAPDKE